MSKPTFAKFGVLLYRTSAAGVTPAVYAKLCGLTNVSISEEIETASIKVRDCDKPNRPAETDLRNTGYSFTITASGNDNITLYTAYKNALGVKQAYSLELYDDDGTDGGELLGTHEGFTAMLTSRQRDIDDSNPGQLSITLSGIGNLPWTEAP